jgi:uncharacterized membrane-anchored protein
MRAFTQLRQMLLTHADLKKKIEAMEKKNDEQFRIVFEAITQFIAEDEKPKKIIAAQNLLGRLIDFDFRC